MQVVTHLQSNLSRGNDHVLHCFVFIYLSDSRDHHTIHLLVDHVVEKSAAALVVFPRTDGQVLQVDLLAHLARS